MGVLSRVVSALPAWSRLSAGFGGRVVLVVSTTSESVAADIPADKKYG
jgi:hypothetical protein